MQGQGEKLVESRWTRGLRGIEEIKELKPKKGHVSCRSFCTGTWYTSWWLPCVGKSETEAVREVILFPNYVISPITQAVKDWQRAGYILAKSTLQVS